MKFSAITITRNEEANIGRWLDSVAWCDERLIVDDASTDSTIKVAKARGATRIIKRAQLGEAKQWYYALSHAKHNWVIWGGADQWLDEQLISDIQTRVGTEDFTSYLVTTREIFLGKILSVKSIPEYKVNWVFSKRHTTIPKLNVHQYILPSGPVGQLSGTMYHNSFRTFTQIFTKLNYYTTLQALDAYKSGMRTHPFRIVASVVYLFFWRMIKLKEYRDWPFGFLHSLCFVIDKLMFQLKLWECQHKQSLSQTQTRHSHRY